MNRGMEFHGEVKSADASGGIAFTLYPSASKTAHTLKSGEVVSIDSLAVSSVAAAGGLTTVGFDGDAAGERAFQGYLAQHYVATRDFKTPHQGPAGVVPALVSPAGNVAAQIHGFITRA